jgi:hypothetical protein
VNYGYIAISASRATYHNFYFKRDNEITAQKVIKVNMDPQKEPNFPKVGLTDIHGQFFELPHILQVLYHLVYVAIATRTNANQEYLWINGLMIDSLTIKDSSSFVESVLHCDTTQDEKKSAIPGSTFTYIINVLGERPFNIGSVARQHNKAKRGKKLQSFYLQPGDAIVFSDREFH